MLESSSELGLRDYLQILHRRRWIIIEVFVILVGVVAVGSFLAKPIYRATAGLLVETGTPMSSPHEELPIVVTTLSASHIRTIETHKRLMLGRPILEAVIDEVPLGLTVGGLSSQLSVQTVRDTDVIEIHVENRDPDLAAKIANSVAANYILQNQEYGRESAASAAKFLEEQLKKIKQDLSAAEQQVEQYKLSTGITDLGKEAGQQITVLGTLAKELAVAQADVQATVVHRQVIEHQLSKQDRFRLRDSTTQSNPVVRQLEIELAKLEQKRAGLLEEYVAESSKVQAVDAQIESVKQQISGMLRTVLAATTEEANPVRDTLLVDAASNRAAELAASSRVDALKQTISQLEAQLSAVPRKEKELGRLIRAQQVADRVYTLLLEKYHEIKVAEAMKLSRARLVEPAVTPRVPVIPRIKFNIALACILGLVLSIMLAALVEYLDDTIKDPDEVGELLAAPILGTVPYFSEQDPMLLTEAGPKSALAEAFQTVYSNLSFAAVDHPVRHLLVTSAGAQEGKTFVTVNLAIAMAHRGNQVIVVDADLRRPSLHKRFGTNSADGLTSVLAGERKIEEVLTPTEVEGLQIVPSGPIPPNPAEVLASDKMVELCSALGERADFVLYDSPPVVMFSDTATLASRADSVLLVIEQGGVSRKLVTDSQDLLDRAHARIVGAVLNKVAREAGRYYYYYYSYYGDEEEEQEMASRKAKAAYAPHLRPFTGATGPE